MPFQLKYKSEYVKKVDEYLQQNQDEYFEFHKTRGSSSDSFESKIRVKLPSKRGFAKYINVSRKTLYNWSDEYLDFKQALERIDQEQFQRLINGGLDGSYNSTITKVLLSANHGIRDGIDTNLTGKVEGVFSDEQVNRIAERVTARKRVDDDTSV